MPFDGIGAPAKEVGKRSVCHRVVLHSEEIQGTVIALEGLVWSSETIEDAASCFRSRSFADISLIGQVVSACWRIAIYGTSSK
jgi:hypothetical protein